MYSRSGAVEDGGKAGPVQWAELLLDSHRWSSRLLHTRVRTTGRRRLVEEASHVEQDVVDSLPAPVASQLGAPGHWPLGAATAHV